MTAAGSACPPSVGGEANARNGAGDGSGCRGDARKAKARYQELRAEREAAIAEALLDGQRIKVVRMGEGISGVVDLESGELLEGNPGQALAERLAVLHMLASQRGNHWVGEGDGEHGSYAIAGALWRPSSRLSPCYMEALRRRSRGEAREGVKRLEDTLTAGERWMLRHKLRGRWDWSFLTLTQPRIHGEADEQSIRRMNHAFGLLRKREAWKTHIRGGVKGLEAPMDHGGAHAHIHFLGLMKYWGQAEIKAEWWECMDQAMQEIHGFGLAEGGDLIVDVRAVRLKGKARYEGEISLEDAVAECVKYVTKTDDLVELDEDGHATAYLHPERLLALELVRRWPRMFELLGLARTQKGVSESAQNAPKGVLADVGGSSLDTTSIFDGGRGGTGALDLGLERGGTLDVPPGKGGKAPPGRLRPPSWRELMDTLSLTDWITLMVARVRSARIAAMQRLSDRGYCVELLSEFSDED